MVASRPAAGPARCAGLRRTLLHGWEQGFPLQDSPFQVLARQTGGTLRELLGHCHTLADTGALDVIRVHWGATLQRVRWRCAVAPAAARLGELQQALGRLPGVTAWEFAEPAAPATPPARDGDPFAGPTLWFEIVARSAASARAQRARIEALADDLLCLALAGRDAIDEPGCRCDAHAGPCGDPELARRCEAGLPLVAHPYRGLSEAVQRSEREVLARLRGWKRQGQLTAVSLCAPVAGAESLWSQCALAGEEDDAAAAALRERLLAQTGIAEVTLLPGHARWPYRFLVGVPGAPIPGDALLARALAACGLASRRRRLLHVRRVGVRAAPLLFADPGDAGAAAHTEARSAAG